MMKRDPDQARRGYSAWSYQEALREGLLGNYHQGELFMQDNAPIHTAHSTADFLARHHIRTMVWPPYSPDLNPIEHLWWMLKRTVLRLYPHLSQLGDSEEEWDEFCKALKVAWRRIPDAYIKKLILSMPRRLSALRRARGYQTKY